MPLNNEIYSASGKLLKVAPPVPPEEVAYVKSYFMQELSGIVGWECLKTDLGGVIHLVQDPEIIQAVNEGLDIKSIFSEETATIGIYPESIPVKIPFTTKAGHVGNVAIQHNFPPYIPVLN